MNFTTDNSDSKQLSVRISAALKFLLSIFLFSANLTFSQYANLFLISPTHSDQLISGKEIIISWTSLNVSKVNIDYSLDSGKTWGIIKQKFPAKPSNLKWNVPISKEPNIILRISEINNEVSSEVEYKLNSQTVSLPKMSPPKDKVSENNSTIKIMPLGDSITEGLLVSDNDVGYRRPLDSLLSNIGFNFDFVGSNKTGLVFDFDRDNEGHGGWHAKHKNLSRRSMVDSLYKWLETADPDVILLHIGTNDIGELDIFNETTEDVISDVEELLDIIDLYEFNYDRSVFVFLAQIIKRIDDPSTPLLNEEDSTIVFNDKLQPLVDNRLLNGDNIALVNQENKIAYPDDLPDGVHPNDLGYEKMAAAWFNAIVNFYNYNPIVLKQPSNSGTIVGNSTIFEISVSGLEPISLQWYKNNQILIGENDTTLFIDSVDILDDGSEFYCSVYNLIDTINSDTVDLYVTPLDEKVDGGLLVYYNFEEGEGEIINDSVNFIPQANLEIFSPTTTEWIDHGLKISLSTSIISDSTVKKIYNECVTSNEITVEAWIKPSLEFQSGPARIVTYSEDGTSRNFTLGQEQNRYSFRLRTTDTSINGTPDVFSSENSVDTNLTQVVFTRNSSGKAIIYVNGEESSKVYIPGNFSNWNSDILFGIGNEFNDERPWIGEFYQVSVYSRALDSNEVLHNLKFGEPGITEVTKPLSLEITSSVINKITLNWSDSSDNEDGFIVERSMINNLNFIPIDSTQENETTYVDNSILEGIPYYYRIKGYNLFNESEPSEALYTVSKSNIVFTPTDLEASSDTLGNVFLTWLNNSTNNYGFIIERRPDLTDSSFYIIDSTQLSSYIDTIPKSYSVFEYRVKAFNFAAESNYSNIFSLSDITDILDKKNNLDSFNLLQNFPNPFNPSTQISFIIPNKSEVKLEVFNSLGERIVILIDSKNYDAGRFDINFNAVHYPSGIYFYRIFATELNTRKTFFDVRKMLLVK